jgi:hypothetical protein
MELELLRMLEDKAADWSRQAPGPEEAIQALITETGLDFPEEYLGLLRYSNGGEGELAVEPWWFVIDPVEDVVERNKDLEIARDLPGYFRFGSSGGGDSLLFNTRESRPWKVYCVDDVGMEEEYVKESAPNFGAFIRAMGHPSPDMPDVPGITRESGEKWLRDQGRLS